MIDLEEHSWNNNHELQDCNSRMCIILRKKTKQHFPYCVKCSVIKSVHFLFLRLSMMTMTHHFLKMELIYLLTLNFRLCYKTRVKYSPFESHFINTVHLLGNATHIATQIRQNPF